MQGCAVWLPHYVDAYVKALRWPLRDQLNRIFRRLSTEAAPPKPKYTSPRGAIRLANSEYVWAQFVYRDGDILVIRAGISDGVALTHKWLRNSDAYRSYQLQAGSEPTTPTM